jgi:hypothetical protein
MKTPSWIFTGIAAGAALIGACSTPKQSDDTASTGGETTTASTSGTGGSIPSLVNVNLENVLNSLSVALSVDRANIPVNAQVPIDVAANVCGVSVSALSASIASGQAGCTAVTTSPQLVQTVQQQVAAGGNVGGGDQTTGSPTNNQM